MGKLKLIGVLIMAVALSACVSRTQGGGWMYSAGEGAEDKKATFAFNLDCEEVAGFNNDMVSGQFIYHDHGYLDENDKHLAIKGVLDPTDEGLLDCKSIEKHGALYTGEWMVPYWAIPTKGKKDGDPDGTAFLTFKDDGNGGPSSGDELNIRLEGTKYNGYSNEGLLQGGNIHIAE